MCGGTQHNNLGYVSNFRFGQHCACGIAKEKIVVAETRLKTSFDRKVKSESVR